MGDFLCDDFLQLPTATTTAIAAENVKIMICSIENWNRFLGEHKDKEKLIMSIVARSMTESLKSIPFLSKVAFNNLKLFANMFHYVPLCSGKILFEAGSIGQSMYIVHSGKVKAHILDKESNRELVLAEVGVGNFFGEISLLVDIPRTATITAIEDSLLLELRKSDCKTMMQLLPEMYEAFDQLMKERTAEHFRHYDIPFFKAIPLDKFSTLAQMCLVQQYPPNSIIFKEGDAGNAFHILTHGEVSVRAKKGDVEFELCRMGPGKYFGEIALVRETTRSATVVTIDRCVVLSISKENFNEFFKECPEALSDFHVKLARYDIDLFKLIYHPLGRSYFAKYLVKEFSSENLKFWLAAKRYKELPIDSQVERDALGQEIYESFVKSAAIEQVNLNSKNVQYVAQRVKSKCFDPDLYSACSEEILALMNSDSFKRFKQGDLFQEFLKESETYVASAPSLLQ